MSAVFSQIPLGKTIRLSQKQLHSYLTFVAGVASKVLLYKLKQPISLKNTDQMKTVIRECKEAGMGGDKVVRSTEKQIQVIEMKASM